MKHTYSIIEAIFYISFGGLIYYLIEILFRGYSHYSMFLCGGIIFYCISLFNRRCFCSLHIITRAIIAAFIITFIELIFGILFNLYLHMQVWDYSNQYYNYKGQICLTFSIIWFFLAFPVLSMDSFIQKHLHKFIFHA